MYSFVASDQSFMGCSTIYNVYDECNVLVSQFVVGYSIPHKLYYITEYRGADGDPSAIGVQSPEELAAILYSFSQIFEYMNYTDVFSSISLYNDYRNDIPDISKELLYMYDSYGEVTHQNSEWFITAEDCNVEELIYKNAIEGTELYLEDDSSGDLFVDLQENTFYCEGDTVDGFYAEIHWDKIKDLVLINNI